MVNSYTGIKEGIIVTMREIELVEIITDYLDKYRIRYSKEIRMGIGVPDISINIGASQSIPSISDYYLLSLAEYINEKGITTICELSEYFSYDKSKIQFYINQLLQQDIVVQTNNVIRKKRKIIGLNLGKTISIEAKIKDWKSGILQAQRYLMFSDYSYLALPEEKIHNVNIEELTHCGIGLIAVKKDGLYEVVKPVLSHECEYKQKYMITSSIIKNNDVKQRKADGIFSDL